METIAVADLEKYWITFEQLLQRWNIREDLLASYCVHVDTSKGNTPLRPHFYQGEFPTPGGETCTRLAKYEPEYKNAAEYLNKSKTESQLVQEFLASISDVKKDTIWFLLSDVEELEAADYSLRFAAEASVTNKITLKLDYLTLDAPITFEEILILWIGKDKYEKMKSYDPEEYFFPENPGPDFDHEYLSLIRGVENQLDSALRNGHIHLFNQRVAAGREFYYEVPYNQGALFAGTREGYGDDLHKCFQFMWHYPDLVGVESESLYFDANEVLQRFPFLKTQPAVSVQELTLECSTSPEQNQLAEILKAKEAKIVELEKTVTGHRPLQQQPQKDFEVTQKEAARKLGVDERTIRNWENGKTMPPDGYPGRRSLSNFLIFVNDHVTSKALKEDARAKNRAAPGGDMNEYSEGAEF